MRPPTWSTATPTTWTFVDGDAERGAFLGPVLLRAQRGAVEPHDVEPFGPVSTVLTYDSVDEAVELAARGKGSLVASVVTHDPEVARAVVLGIAPWHGRVHVLDRDDAAESTGHGSPLPMLVHGGPGRAGGGEELGGVRAVLGHMQRTAVQASPDLMTAITGRWTTGSQRATRTGCTRSARASREMRIGDTIASACRQVTLADIDHFAEFTGDTFYAHTDPEAAAREPAVRRHRRARLPRRVAGRRPLRRPGPRARCWPTSASTTSGSSRPSRPTTRSRSR